MKRKGEIQVSLHRSCGAMDAETQRRFVENGRVAVERARQHLAEQTGVPKELEAALVVAETNYRMNGFLLPLLQIDDNKGYMPIPEEADIQAHLYRCLGRLAKKKVIGWFMGGPDRLCVAYVGRDREYFATCSVGFAAGKVQMGKWRIERGRAAGSGTDRHPAGDNGNGKTGRNQPCPCGSGRKFKKCCGKIRSDEPLTRDQFADEMIRRIVAAGEKGRLTVDRSSFSLLRDGQRHLNLHNAYAEYRESTARSRDAILTHWTRAWFLYRHEMPTDYDDAKHDLLPVVQSRAIYECGSGEDAYRLLGDHHAVGLAYDLPSSIWHIGTPTLEKWGVAFEEAHAAAMDNLRSISFPPKFVPSTDRLIVSAYSDDYDSSRILLPELFSGAGLHGDPVVIVPNRRTLLLAGSEDEGAIAAMADLAWNVAQKPRFLSGIPLRLRDSGWETYVPPYDHPAFAAFRKLWYASLSDEYAQQKRMLDEKHEREGLDIFVAQYMAILPRDGGTSASMSVWTEGVASLLPRSDLIVLIPDDFVRSLIQGTAVAEDGVMVVPWESFQESMADILVPIDGYPPRYRVERFPAREQLDALKRSLATRPWPTGIPDMDELRKHLGRKS